MKKVSIIIANYNNAQYLPECFDSILSQAYKDIEIVVVDDCSTDHSREIIQSYNSKYSGLFTPVLLPENKGVARARHQGILKAKGQYITTLDADDYYADSRKLDEEMRLVLDYKNQKNSDIIAFSNILQKINDGKTHLAGNKKNIAEGFIIEQILARSCMIPRDFVFLKSAYYEVGGYDFGLITHEDWDLKIRLANLYEFHCTGLTGTAYRQHPYGLSSIPHKLRTNNLNKVFSKNISLITDRIVRTKVIADYQVFMQKRDNSRISFLKQKHQTKKDVTNSLSFYIDVYKDMGVNGLRLLIKY